jgi:thiol-disulfide isomerase/thioredoxin
MLAQLCFEMPQRVQVHRNEHMSWQEAISRTLVSKGYARFTLEEGQFAHLLKQLGTVLQTTTVQLLPHAPTYLTSPQALPPHTDHPHVRHILWQCVVQDEEDGAQILLDGHQICAQLGEEVAKLRAVFLPVPPLHGLKPNAMHPMLNDEGLYWAPWRKPCRDAKPGFAAWQKFKQLTEQQFQATQVRLKPSEFLLIDNRRTLHGRNALPHHSKRLLRRWWFASNRTPQESGAT